jgi:hypothetical protein
MMRQTPTEKQGRQTISEALSRVRGMRRAGDAALDSVR